MRRYCCGMRMRRYSKTVRVVPNRMVMGRDGNVMRVVPDSNSMGVARHGNRVFVIRGDFDICAANIHRMNVAVQAVAMTWIASRSGICRIPA